LSRKKKLHCRMKKIYIDNAYHYIKNWNIWI